MTSKSKLPIICLMGPTASGKTSLAIEITQHFPCEIISVDSAMVYRHMNIGTAKPTKEILQKAPHRLIDLLDPKDSYSAGQFRTDALSEIDKIHQKKKVPLLVGGTMLYFRVLQKGIAELPQANQKIRAELQERADKEGWQALHTFLAEVDPHSATRINNNDSQRIQRALEVYLVTGQPISKLQQATAPLANYAVQNIVVAPHDRGDLHTRIASRFNQMLQLGFVDEVKMLFERGDLHEDLPSMRSVGYTQIWSYLSGHISYDKMVEQSLAANRQLAKRQMTWLRRWPQVCWFDSNSNQDEQQIFSLIDKTCASMF